MKVYEFDRKEFVWAEEFYEILQDRMNFPEWFGKNPDALWDMLTGFVEMPCEIVLKGFQTKENNYNANELNKIIACFEDATKLYPNQFHLTKK